MIRFVFVVLLLLAPLVHAQGVEPWITRALADRCDPITRLDLLDLIIKEGGVDALASRGLSPDLTTEVIHAVVAKLFATNHAVRHIEPIARLLVTKHEDVVARRIQTAADERSVAQELIEALEAFALPDENQKASKDVQLRISGVRALRQIPQRAAVEMIVNTWNGDSDLGVKEACRAALENVLVPRSAEAARQYLKKNDVLTYRDLRDEVIKALRAGNAALRDHVMKSLRHASAEDCFTFLRSGGELERRNAATRLSELAKTRDFGTAKPNEFAQQVFEAFGHEIERGDVEAVAALVGTLSHLVNGNKAPPLTGKKQLDALYRAVSLLATRKGWDKVGFASVELLGKLGVDAVVSLYAFARSSDSVDVRKAAVNKIGTLARLGTEQVDFVGQKLVHLLEAEKNPEIRRQILGNMRSAPVVGAVKPIQALLESPKTLVESEVEYCIEILRRLESKDAFLLLVKLAQTHKVSRLRLYAFREGLLLRKVAPEKKEEEQAAVYDLIERTATSDPQQEIRDGVVSALGKRGDARAYDLLRKLAANATLAEAAVAATLDLVNRLAKESAGIETASRAVRDRVGDDLDKLDQLAAKIIATCTKANKAAKDVRYLRATMYADRKDTKRPERLQRFQDAAAKAEADGLADKQRIDLCERYKAELLRGPTTDDNRKEAIVCLNQLAKLAGAEQATAVGHLLEAATLAVQLKNRKQADSLFTQAKNRGAEEQVLAELRKKIDGIPKAG